jgi:inorganic triphosphatase YgiF
MSSSKCPSEIEIRLSLTENCLPSVERQLFSNANHLNEYNQTTYFDTSGAYLWKHGVECRIRRSAKGIIQTVKHADPILATFTRTESEIELETEQLSLDHLRECLPDAAREELDETQLAPVFTADVQRRRQIIKHDGARIEAALDIGRIVCGSRHANICELELELKDGAPAALADAALAMLQTAPAHLQTAGKAARGFRLLSDVPPAPVYAQKVSVTPDTPLPEAIAAMLRAALVHSHANHDALVETDDPEAVHQMRIGLRRLRAILSAFKPVLDLRAAENLLEETKQFFALLGDVREADVFLEETLTQFPDDVFGLDVKATLSTEVERFRKSARRRVQDLAVGPAFARLIISWYGWIEGGRWLRNEQPIDRLLQVRPVGDFALGRLHKMRRRLRKAGRQAMRGPVDDWHIARIAAKKTALCRCATASGGGAGNAGQFG